MCANRHTKETCMCAKRHTKKTCMCAKRHTKEIYIRAKGPDKEIYAHVFLMRSMGVDVIARKEKIRVHHRLKPASKIVCRVSNTLVYSTAWYHMYILIPYILLWHAKIEHGCTIF